MMVALTDHSVRALTVVALTVVLAVAACTSGNGGPTVSQRLEVGLTRVEAEQRLDRAGATLANAVDSLGPAPTDALEDGAFYGLRDGSLLEIGYRRPAPTDEYLVDTLSLCRDPNVAKSERTFESVQELDI